MRGQISPPVEPLEGWLFGGQLEVLAANGDTLLSRVTGDLQHLELHLADGRGKLQGGRKDGTKS